MATIAEILLAFYDDNARDLPWRVGPNSPAEKHINPYHIWLSEIMLQQTTVAAVIPYFEKFTTLWPDFNALAKADNADVMAAWAGLGYYARARNLVKCARMISSEYAGKLPQTESELKKLPGIGDYTAAAVASIAFGQRALVLDANIERVMTRLFLIDTPLPKGKSDIKAALGTIVPQDRAGDFAQAMMDLGASYCSVKNPKCQDCPIQSFCKASLSGKAELYPVKLPKKIKPERMGMAWWITYKDHVLLIKRDSAGMLGGMRALPDDGWTSKQDGDAILPVQLSRIAYFNENNFVKNIHYNEVVQHSFTHFSLKLKLIAIELMQIDGDMSSVPNENIFWWPIDRIEEAGLPTLFGKAVQKIQTASV